MRVLVREVKWNAVGRRTVEQQERWFWFVAHAANTGRAVVVPGTSTVIGNDWFIECDDREHAEWLCGWLKDFCGFMNSMLKVRR